MAIGTPTTAGAVRIVSGGSLKAGITYVALYKADPGDAGSHANEVTTGTGYARQAVTWSSSGGVTEQNTNVLNWAATGSWGTVTHWGLVNSATRGAGTMLAHGPLNSSRVMANGNQIRMLAGQIKITGLTT